MKRYIRAAISPIENEDWASQVEIAKDPTTPVEVLAKLRKIALSNAGFRNLHYGELLNAVLWNPNALTEWVVAALRSDTARPYDLITNPKVPVGYLEQCVAKGDFGEMWLVASNPSTPAYLLEKMADTALANERGTVLCGIARHPNTPLSVLERLAEYDDEWVRYYALHNPNASEEMHKEFEEIFNKVHVYYVNIMCEGDEVNKQYVDNAMSEICGKHNIEFYGSEMTWVDNHYEFDEVDDHYYKYEATVEFIFERKVRDDISLEFTRKMIQLGYAELTTEWDIVEME